MNREQYQHKFKLNHPKIQPQDFTRLDLASAVETRTHPAQDNVKNYKRVGLNKKIRLF